MYKKNKSKSVLIILGFYNDKEFIRAQVDSILSQTHKNLKIYIYDDNSKFNLTKSFLNLNQKDALRVSIIKRSHNIGSAKNFLYALKEIKEKFDFFGFSDQDDIWEKDKIEHSLNTISGQNKDDLILFGSRTAYYNADCTKKIGESKIFKKKLSFSNALIQSIIGGNTMLMNASAKDLLSKSINSEKYIEHDWYCYQIITACGGKVFFSKKKTLKYRQHDNNLTGRNDRLGDKLKRLNKFLSGNFREWNNINIENLMNNKNLIKKENFKILQDFVEARNSKNGFRGLFFYIKSGVYRQSLLDNFIFLFGIFFKKI